MRISNFSESDVGVYTCIASNVMGRANDTIRLYGKFLFDGSWNLWQKRLIVTTIKKIRETAEWTLLALDNLIIVNYCIVKSFFHFPSFLFLFHYSIAINHIRNQNSHDDYHNNTKANNDDFKKHLNEEANNKRLIESL